MLFIFCDFCFLVFFWARCLYEPLHFPFCLVDAGMSQTPALDPTAAKSDAPPIPTSTGGSAAAGAAASDTPLSPSSPSAGGGDTAWVKAICLSFKMGKCLYGAKCKFSHNLQPTPASTPAPALTTGAGTPVPAPAATTSSVSPYWSGPHLSAGSSVGGAAGATASGGGAASAASAPAPAPAPALISATASLRICIGCNRMLSLPEQSQPCSVCCLHRCCIGTGIVLLVTSVSVYLIWLEQRCGTVNSNFPVSTRGRGRGRGVRGGGRGRGGNASATPRTQLRCLNCQHQWSRSTNTAPNKPCPVRTERGPTPDPVLGSTTAYRPALQPTGHRL